MRQITLVLFLLVIVTGVYVLPSVIATFAGGHTMEVNESGVEALQCTDCHQYILDELNTTKGRDVYEAHKSAAENTTYTQNWLNMTINETREKERTCYLCHQPQMPIASHTQTVVRACTDLDCHGTNESTNNTAYYAGNAGPRLGNQTNVHERWFDGMSGYDSTYVNESNINYTKGYWACLGCHTNVEVSMNVTKETYDHSEVIGQRRYI
jgi:D-alanyl-D-alanine carboxypeptidase